MTSPSFLDARGRAYPLGLEPNLVTIIPLEAGGRVAAELIAAGEPGVELVPDAERGVLPRVFGVGDQRQIRRWLYGAGGAVPRSERLTQLRRCHDLPSDSVADAALAMIEEGLPEERAVALVREWHQAALAEGTGYREPWVAEAAALIAVLRDRRAKEAAR
ncbi:MAG TPA: hypothetical protein VNO79_10370 [Actinomycetota bacterium]|nr:hypothetical protein [Actinomycetota bacterium]